MSVEIRALAMQRLWERHPEATINGLPMGEPPPGAWVIAYRWPRRNRRNLWTIRYIERRHAEPLGRRVLVLYRPEEETQP
jgi:hypothetical protein